MHFEYRPAAVRETAEGPRFRIGRLTVTERNDARDVTALVDRTYDYASARELRWHLAERFRLPAAAVTVRAA
ncbi:AsnC family transcriptional regulator [Chthonobacter rhizosphaerae]|uniref:AsnC family transcriptional regulator n=1 Tax=Chthonobacter rhizosphaerae TaxID=2735553 RepID=UPI0015EF7822|nr:AsnC family transcriptional regulator [Chthonobacter rhizosphaerae]